jgi:GNAT superfamily N-acetyltransferase
MKFEIRKANAEDFPSVLSLVKELAEFEKAPEKVSNTVELMRNEKELFHCYVAEKDDKEIIGIALYFFAYFTWVGKSLYLEDIYVKEKYRGMHIGSDLMNRIFEVARFENCKRIRWQVLKWNENAIAMYKKFGAEIDYDWCNCTVDQNGIQNLMNA